MCNAAGLGSQSRRGLTAIQHDDLPCTKGGWSTRLLSLQPTLPLLTPIAWPAAPAKPFDGPRQNAAINPQAPPWTAGYQNQRSRQRRIHCGLAPRVCLVPLPPSGRGNYGNSRPRAHAPRCSYAKTSDDTCLSLRLLAGKPSSPKSRVGQCFVKLVSHAYCDNLPGELPGWGFPGGDGVARHNKTRAAARTMAGDLLSPPLGLRQTRRDTSRCGSACLRASSLPWR